MSLTVVEYPGYHLYKITGYLDGKTSESQELKTALSRPSHQIEDNTVLDLSGVDYVNSSILGLFIRYLSESQKVNKQVILLAPAPSVASVLQITGISYVFPLVNDEAEVREALGHAAGPDIHDKDVDYDALENELESIITDTPRPEDNTEIDKLLDR